MAATSDMPISSIAIDNFRGLRDFRMEGAAPVFNLLVGPSEIGKTTVLEAIDLMSFGHLADVNFLNLLRGARVENERDAIIAVASFFHNFCPAPISMTVRARNDYFGDVHLRLEVAPVKGDDVVSHNEVRGMQAPVSFLEGPDQFDGLKLSLEMSGAVIAKGHGFLRPQGKSMQSSGDETSQKYARADKPETLLSQKEIEELQWRSYLIRHPMPKVAMDMATMNKKKDSIVEILRMINPDVRDVATVGDAAYMDIGLEKMVSMHIAGDGMRQVLGTLGHLCPKYYDIYLEDEIGAGVYFGVQPAFLRAVLRFAKREGKQIFATTHSMDMLKALQKVLTEEEDLQDDAAVFSFMRDKHGKIRADAYLYEDIDRCISNGKEIR